MQHIHIIVNISTKYHKDTLITCEVMARTRYKLQNFDLWPLSLTLNLWHRVMGPTYQSEHFNQLSWRYNNNLWRYSPGQGINYKILTLTSKCDLDLWHWVMGLVRDKLTYLPSIKKPMSRSPQEYKINLNLPFS